MSETESSDAWPNGAPDVGQTAEMSRLIKPEYIELFSEVSGDYNPVHYDEEVARASPFGEIIVQGGVTSSILNAVVAQELPGPGTVFLQLDLSFKAPVRPGDTITGVVEITERDGEPGHDAKCTTPGRRLVRGTTNREEKRQERRDTQRAYLQPRSS